MPGSTVSGNGSQASSGSRRAKTRSYHVVAHTSQIDESLFGQPQSQVKRQEMLAEKTAEDCPLEQQAAQRCAKRKGKKNGNRETVQVVTKDLIRNLVIPQEDPSGHSIILDGREFNRILNAAKVLTEEEKKARLEEMKRYKEEMMDEVQAKKQFMKMKDLNRRKNEKLNEIEEEEMKKSEHLRQRALEQLQEQEDEIKALNELILNAKCHAIRDAQILEKDQISTEMEHEEKRLDTMMEADRINALKIEEEILKKRKEERLIGAMKIMEQIQENEQEHLLDIERKDQENRMMQKYLDKLCEEEADKLDKKRHEQQHLREELNHCNAEMINKKELEKEQNKLEELKVIEWQKAKAEREQAYEKEQERQRIEKEREVARLRTLQERARDEQAERDALRAKRAQENAERDWRRKEAEEMRRKAETEAMLKAARAQQMEQKGHFLAVQAQRERADFERVLRAQQELIEKERQEEDEKKGQRRKYASDVRSQIREKEQVRVSERNAFFEEGVKLDEEARQRRLKLEEVKKKKLDELRAAGIPDKYVGQIERKINQPQHISA